MTEHECPKAFYCLPESCGDCPRDQQDEQPTTCPWCDARTTHAYPVEHDRTRTGTRFFECGSSWCYVDGMRPQHERCQRDLDKIAEGERAERERIIGILKTVQAIDYNTPIGEQPYMVISGIIDEIREGRA